MSRRHPPHKLAQNTPSRGPLEKKPGGAPHHHILVYSNWLVLHVFLAQGCLTLLCQVVPLATSGSANIHACKKGTKLAIHLCPTAPVLLCECGLLDAQSFDILVIIICLQSHGKRTCQMRSPGSWPGSHTYGLCLNRSMKGSTEACMSCSCSSQGTAQHAHLLLRRAR